MHNTLSPRCIRKRLEGGSVPNEMPATITRPLPQPPHGKVEVLELEEKLRGMRHKRLNRLSNFISEQTKLSEQRSQNPEIEEAIMSWRQTDKPSFKKIVEQKVMKKDRETQLSSKSAPLRTCPEETEENFREKQGVHFNSNFHPSSSNTKPESPRTPTRNMRKFFNTFGGCAKVQGNFDDNGKPVDTDPYVKSSNNISESHFISKKENETPSESLSDANTGISIENPIYGICAVVTNIKTDHSHIAMKDDRKHAISNETGINNAHLNGIQFKSISDTLLNLSESSKVLEKILRGSPEIQKQYLEDLFNVASTTNNFFTDIKTKLGVHVNSNDFSLNACEQKLATASKDIACFRGLRRDSGYALINNELTNMSAFINNIEPNNKDAQNTKNRLVQEINALIKTLEEKVKRNEEILREVFDEEVTLIRSKHLCPTIV